MFVSSFSGLFARHRCFAADFNLSVVHYMLETLVSFDIEYLHQARTYFMVVKNFLMANDACSIWFCRESLSYLRQFLLFFYRTGTRWNRNLGLRYVQKIHLAKIEEIFFSISTCCGRLDSTDYIAKSICELVSCLAPNNFWKLSNFCEK